MVGGARARLPRELELREESLASEATLAESDSRSSQDTVLLDGRAAGLNLEAPPT